ncbi:PREDICTED: F-box and leucine-rich protein 22 [Bison bison bison]|uniref:F-box and leucine-rich protein 22 n=1 Tax=Bison bison bison TaxID=43346 RepID=A0A6P3H512_BISBB|nr:PREDICTED: F-box and leucine-rich protein 22 [Bison bison bison]
MSGSGLPSSSERQHQLSAKNKHHSSTIYVHQPGAGEEQLEVGQVPGLQPHSVVWPLRTMHITQLNRECLLHLFSFLDKDSRKNLARTCPQLQDVFEDPALWPLLHFRSLTELKKDNFLLSPALRSLSICWHSSRVQVCSIEDWLKSALQRNICSRHESLVNDFLLQVCDRCPNLASVTLSGCGHVTDDCLARLLRCCPRLRALHLAPARPARARRRPPQVAFALGPPGRGAGHRPQVSEGATCVERQLLHSRHIFSQDGYKRPPHITILYIG